MGKLEGKVAVITGGASGMGAAHAKVLHDEGAKVVITDVQDNEGEALALEIGAGSVYLHHDVTDPESWASLVAQVTETFGPITILVNNAGVAGPEATTVSMTSDAYLKTIAVDQHGVFFGMQAVIPGMVSAGGGSIINISSVAGFAHVVGVPNPAYTAAKFAVRGLTKAAAAEFGPDKVRVNSIHPGTVLTPMVAASVPEHVLTQVTSTVPLRRAAQPEEISQLVVFLASDDAAFITGAEHVIDGGQLAV
ncbi:glucose 1-dehydrogenase [Subtercola endophyticus]|uniref:glucose 1-dehydrogenase n=1 Tax=Subtercola endophyticus TaxID=2895559 RepID=UPI001E37F46A|nr:glucose 1-dehydrogenase [Subtercola endophyticus]UFS60177.1 glucose 1-dehydrogenase [Subtercola endophyticus]